jgi:uncharacterized iron-regulated membrane protein
MKFWVWLHKWSSLISVLVLLPIFISGLPLVFKTEINQALGYGAGNVNHGQLQTVDSLIASAKKARPNKFVQFIAWEDGKPDAIIMSMADTPDELPYYNESILVSPYSGKVLTDKSEPLDLFLKLHTKLFLDKSGATYLGIVAIALLLSLISGVVIYKPFAAKRPFGDVRSANVRSSLGRWLDLHNVIGICITGWILVVTITGLINSWGEYVVAYWRYDQVSKITKEYQDLPTPDFSKMISVDDAFHIAMEANPDSKPWFISMPRSVMTDSHHYAIYLVGNTPRTKQLVQPIFVDALTGKITASPNLPWYMMAMMLSQPLHFGDYGGTALKIIWALFTLISIFVLASGLYLWWLRHRLRGDNLTLQELTK